MLTSHLTPLRWASANRHLVAKALSEFSHERLITPSLVGAGKYELECGAVSYCFDATIRVLEHWSIDASSIVRKRDGVLLPLDAAELVLELRVDLGLSDEVLPVYLEEISATLAAAAYKLEKPSLSAAELVTSDFQVVESAMTEGHPCFVANNGRLGFGVDDYRCYAPEVGRPISLIWLAARRDVSTFSSCADTDHDAFFAAEFGTEVLARFTAILAAWGLDLADYHLLPVHPWQWHNKLAVTFAGEIAQQRLVYLGESDDHHVAQQSIRTFFNATTPSRSYVKTALSVLNMGFMRGLSAAYMQVTPAINDWLTDLVTRDEVLRDSRLVLLRERAAIGYHHRQLEAATSQASPYRKMLAALWRESPVPLLEPGEQVITMAALVHLDADGRSYASALIEHSGLEPDAWLRAYLDAYLIPVVHCLYAYDLAFMPHGENVLLGVDNGLVTRAFFKDLAEEVAVMDLSAQLPEQVQRIQVEVPPELKPLALFTDVFDCFFRFLSAQLDEDGVLSEAQFWGTVASCIKDYQQRCPELASRYDLFVPEFALSCLNRLQLRNNRQLVDLADPAGSLQLVGTLTNPIARYR